MTDRLIAPSTRDAMLDEIASQPDCWEWAIEHAIGANLVMPTKGARAAVLGCGTSWFVAQSYAALREANGFGVTDAFSPATLPNGRHYDHLIVVSRSGTTTDLIDPLRTVSCPSTLLTTVAGSPLGKLVDHTMCLERAAETSIVQTRSATTALCLLRTSVGDDVSQAIQDGRAALADPLRDLPDDPRQLVFLGETWSIGVAREAALKCAEAAGQWAEAHALSEYRHGPFASANVGTVVWSFAPLPGDVANELRTVGAVVIESQRDPMAELIRVQRYAHRLACLRGRDPARPMGLSFSVVLGDES